MATLDEIERSWGYDDSDWDDDEIDPFAGDDDPDDDLYDGQFLFDDDSMDGFYRRTRHTCTIYTVCNACGKLEYATRIRWWTAANLCQCLPF